MNKISEDLNLHDELTKLRHNFHFKLAAKRGLYTDRNEIEKISKNLNDNQIQNHFEKFFEMRKWFSFFRSR